MQDYYSLLPTNKQTETHTDKKDFTTYLRLLLQRIPLTHLTKRLHNPPLLLLYPRKKHAPHPLIHKHALELMGLRIDILAQTRQGLCVARKVAATAETLLAGLNV